MTASPTPDRAAEFDALRETLSAQRQQILRIVEQMDEPALRRSVLPSGWTALTLIRHLTCDIESFWFRCVMRGDPATIAGLSDDPAYGWTVPPDATSAHIIARYRQEIAAADVIVAGMTPDTPPAWWPGDLFGDFRMDSLREELLHVIVETTRHAGHLDIVRELISGEQWLVLT